MCCDPIAMRDETWGSIVWWVATIVKWVVLISLGLFVLLVALVMLGLIGP
jgi:hypothetical protein